MIPAAGEELEVKWEGLLIALASFIVTRGFLVSTLFGFEDPLQSVAKLAPLVVGLGVAVYGVDLALSTHERAYVNTVALWYLIGTIGMAFIVGIPALAIAESGRALLANELIGAAIVGGGVGGILVGNRTATLKRHQHQLERRADQAELVNHLLRHEILNAMTAIQGYTELLADDRTGYTRSQEVILESSERIIETVEDVGFIIRTGGEADSTSVVELETIIDEARARTTGADIVDSAAIPEVSIRGTHHLATAISELLDTARIRTEATPTLSVSTTKQTADIQISAPGSWLSERERRTLTDRLPAYEHPDVGYSLAITNLLVTQFRGTISVSEGDGTVVTLGLPVTSAGAPTRNQSGIGVRGLEQATLAGVLAGLAMGGILHLLAGGVGIIGALYGSPTPVVGWITHLFHSVVFATIFAGAVSHPRLTDVTAGLSRVLGLAVAFGVILWLGAAGFIMGLWLNAVGIPTAIPNLSPVSFLGHVVWGVVLALVLWFYPEETT